MARGELLANGVVLSAGDGLALQRIQALELRAETAAQALLFDMA